MLEVYKASVFDLINEIIKMIKKDKKKTFESK